MVNTSKRKISGRRWWRIPLIIIVLIFIGIQFYRPNKNIQEVPTGNDFLIYQKAPDNVAALITNSCYDCHSDYSDYAWYDYIAPVTWYVDSHVAEAREHLNLSEWAGMNYRKKRSVLAYMSERITDGSMPLSSYTFAHRDAIFSEEEMKIVLDWLGSIEIKAPSFN